MEDHDAENASDSEPHSDDNSDADGDAEDDVGDDNEDADADAEDGTPLTTIHAYPHLLTNSSTRLAATCQHTPLTFHF